MDLLGVTSSGPERTPVRAHPSVGKGRPGGTALETRCFMLIEDTNQRLLIDHLDGCRAAAKTIVELYGQAGPRVPELRELEAMQRQKAEQITMLGDVLRRFGHTAEETSATSVAHEELRALVEITQRSETERLTLLEALHHAALVDYAQWELLVALLKRAPIDRDIARDVRAAGRAAKEHLHFLREHLFQEMFRALSTRAAEVGAGQNV